VVLFPAETGAITLPGVNQVSMDEKPAYSQSLLKTFLHSRDRTSSWWAQPRDVSDRHCHQGG
jgi:hypothetical protein